LSPSQNDIDPRVLGQLLAAQSVFSIFSARQKMGEFVSRVVEGVPGVAFCAVCLPGAERPRLGGEPAPECADCDVPEGDVDHDPNHPCRLSSRAGIQIFPLKTQDRHFGFLFLKLEEREEFATYEPFVSNLANSLAVNIDRQWQKERLEAANVELRRYREHLEELVRERTTELQLGLKREHHLNAVLRAIRNVNQLIVREKDRELLLQQACVTLTETRDFRSVWVVRLGADGRVEATAEAGIGPAFAGLRSQLERGELPECCRRALASAGPVVLTNPTANCAACPLPNACRDTAGIAVPLRHEGRTYGVLIAALPAEMAADAEEISLFNEVAGDIAFALHAIEGEQERNRVEAEIRTLNAELEQRVQDRTARLEAANKELDAFSYSVSHDLRAPLRHVQGYVDMLGREAEDRLSENGRRYMKTIEDASREMGVLIDDLLAFSRTGRAQMAETTVSLNGLVQESIQSLEMATRGRNIVWTIPPLPTVQGDPAMLKLVLANLLGNAVKFTRPRDPAVIEVGMMNEECRMKNEDTLPDSAFCIPHSTFFVRDNGVGFDPQYVHKLFGVFQRLHRADEFEGTGIGLANVRRIIARHGGRTWAEGAVDKGATFYFTLRVK
jgi:signal transduction histidine kinase